MIEYIVQNQNSYFYSHLFEKNLVQLLEKGASLTNLFNSRVFNHEFDFDEWPSTHYNIKESLRPYNKSMFGIRFEYKNIFSDIYNADMNKKR